MFIARAKCGLKQVTAAALCSSCSLRKYLGDHQLCMKQDDQC